MWFEIDKAGLAAILERRGKVFALFELVQNAWDAGPSHVRIRLNSIPGIPYARLEVEDDSPNGWADLRDAYTMFGRSSRAAEHDKRGRFCLGEKLVLALCRSASIQTAAGTVIFDETGRHNRPMSRLGTLFVGEIRMTRDELAEVLDAASGLIPPVRTTINGNEIDKPALLKTFECKLPTEVADADGVLRRSARVATVEAYDAAGGAGQIVEMGIPVCSAEFPWILNVLQKVPLGMDRDSVTDAFRTALQVAAVNALADTIDAEQAAAPWAAEALEDARITSQAAGALITKRFGDRAVIAVPGDPLANAAAEANGCTVIHGGALSGGAWANVRKHAIVPTASAAFPTPRPAAVPMGEADGGRCPLCGK